MNYRKGGLRFLIATTMLWSAFWSWTYYDATSSAEGSNPQGYFNGRRLEAGDFQLEQVARRGNALRFGLGGLGALLAMLLVVTWMSRPDEDP